MAKKKKGTTTVTIYPDWCKGCGICAAFCPAQVLEMDPQLGKARVVREDDCINCGFCELHCPDFAISVRPREREAVGTGGVSERTTDAPASQPKEGAGNV